MVRVRIGGKNKYGRTFESLDEAKVVRDKLVKEQRHVVQTKKSNARAHHGATPDAADWDEMRARTTQGKQIIDDAQAQVDAAHREKEEEAAKAVVAMQNDPKVEWRLVPMEAFEPVRDFHDYDDARQQLTDAQKVAIQKCQVESSAAGKMRWQIFKNGGKTSHETFGWERDGYMNVDICSIEFRVHHLVCWTFHGAPPEKGVTADHKHHCTKDNRISQLAWATRAQQSENRRVQRFGLGVAALQGAVFRNEIIGIGALDRFVKRGLCIEKLRWVGT